MPQNKYALARYGLIDKILRKETYVKTSHIVTACKHQFGYDLTQRTVQLDLDAMKNDTFLGIFAPIEYSQKNKAYYYTHTDFEFAQANFSQDEVQLLESVCGLLKNKLEDHEHEKMLRILGRIKRNSMAK